MHRFAPSIASAVAQGLGLLQIVVLFWGRGATTESDLYFLLFVWTQMSYQLVLAGIVYPTWLRGHGASARTVRVMVASTVPLAAMSAGCGLLVWVASGHSQSGALGVAVLFAVQGVLASLYWIGALWVASQGRPLFVSGATFLPNLTAVALGTVAALMGADRVAPIVVGQCAGFLAGLAVLVGVHGNVWGHAWHWTSTDSAGAAGGGRSTGWFAAQAVAGYGSLLVLQSMTASLPGSSLSQLGTIQRVQTGLNGVVVNASLPRLVHQGSRSRGLEARRFLELLVFWTVVATSLCTIIARNMGFGFANLVPIIGALFLGASINAGVKRVAARFLSASIAWVTILVSVVVGAVALLVGDALSLEVVLVLYGVLEIVPGVVIALVLGWWGVAVLYGCVVGVGLALGVAL